MLNKSDIQGLATFVGKTAEEIKAAITSEEEVNLDVSKSIGVLRTNWTNQVFKSKENQIKTHVKNTLNIDIEGDKKIEEMIDQLVETVTSKQSENLQAEIDKAIEIYAKDSNINVDERIGQLKEKNENAIKLWEEKHSNLLKKYEVDEKEWKTNWETERFNRLNEKKVGIISSAFSQLPDFKVPDQIKTKGEDAILTYKQSQKRRARNDFDSLFDLRWDENENPVFIDKLTGKDVADEFEKAKPINDLIEMVKETYFWQLDADQRTGKNGQDSKPGDISLKDIKNENDLNRLREKRGIAVGSDEELELFKEVKKMNPEFR